MTRRSSRTVLPAAAFLLLSALAGQAQEGAGAASSIEAEFEAVALSLTARIAEHCAPEAREVLDGRAIGFGLQPAGFAIRGLAPDQAHNLMLQINEGFRKLKREPGLVYVPTFDLERALLERPASQHSSYRARVEEQAHLRITPSVSAEGDFVRFTLNADPAPGGKLDAVFACQVSSDSRRIPPEVIGEAFTTPAELFRRFAGGIYDRIARERTRLEVIAADTKVEPLSDEAVTVILKEINQQKDTNFTIGADRTPIEVLKGRSPNAAPDPSGNRWTVELKLIEQTREAKLIINATPSDPDAQAFADQALVRLASLPAQSIRSLQTVAVSGAAAGATRLRSAALLPVGSSLRRLSTRLEAKGSAAFSVVLDNPSILEVDIEQVAKRDLRLLDEAGREVKPAFAGTSRPNLRRYAMLQGSFLLVVSNAEAAAAEVVLRTRTARTMLEPEAPGDLTRTFGDWAVGLSSAQGRKVCFAYTTATEGSSVRRLQRPVIWFSTESEKDAPLVHFVDDARFYRNPGSARASVAVSGQTSNAVVLSEIEGRLVPAQTNAAGRPVLSDASIRGFTLGRSIAITGTDETGRDSRVVYSLIGYKQAITSMATLCDRPELAQKLVW